jgi:hypothetical protein
MSERGDGEKNSKPLPGLEPPIIQPVALYANIITFCNPTNNLYFSQLSSKTGS